MSRIEMFRAYLAKKPGDRFALYSLALEHKKAGEIEASEQAFRDLLAAHPASGAGHYQLGLLLLEADRIDDARAAWTAGLEALRGLADPEARRSAGEIEGALSEIEPD